MFLGGQHTSNGIYITSSIVSAFRCLTKAQRQYLPERFVTVGGSQNIIKG